jgi:hypothetical protein
MPALEYLRGSEFMPLQLSLPSELEARLEEEARRKGLSPATVTLELLDRHLPAADRRAALIALLQQWQVEDQALTEAEAAANRSVLRAIDEDRLSDRKLFTDYAKDTQR